MDSEQDFNSKDNIDIRGTPSIFVYLVSDCNQQAAMGDNLEYEIYRPARPQVQCKELKPLINYQQ